MIFFKPLSGLRRLVNFEFKFVVFRKRVVFFYFNLLEVFQRPSYQEVLKKAQLAGKRLLITTRYPSVVRM